MRLMLAALIATLLFVPNVFADGGAQCGLLFRAEAGRPSVASQAADLIARKREGISDRGFLSGYPEATGDLAAAVAKEGIIWWYIRIFVVPSVEAAKAHAALEKDPLMQGVYLINSGKTAEETAALTNEKAGDVFKRMLANDQMYFFRVKDNLATQVVPPDYIAKNLTPENMAWDLDDPEHGPYIRENGWTFRRYTGVLEASKTILAKSSTYANIRQLARKLYDQGFRIHFSRDFKRALNMVRDQKRYIEGQWIANSLYAGESNANYRQTLESYESGRAYSVEVWNEKDEMVGGIIGFRDGTLYSPESTFYDQERYPKISIGFAKWASMVLTERLHAAGIPFADVGMLSDFSASMKGELIDMELFLQMMATLPAKADVDFTTPYTPPAPAPQQQKQKTN